MYEKTGYFSRRFIRNGIGALICGFLALSSMNRAGINQPLAYFFPVLACLWLGLGFLFQQKLKTKTIDTDSKLIKSDNYKRTEGILTALLFISLYMIAKNVRFGDITMGVVGVIYLIWILREVKLIYKYLQ